MTAAVVAGMTLGQLAAQRGIAYERMAAIIEPFIANGIVQELQDGRLVVVHPDIVEAFADWEAPHAKPPEIREVSSA